MSQIAVFDTSVLLKLYIPEPFAGQVRTISLSGVLVAISAVAGTEVASALRRRTVEGSITGEERRSAWQAYTQQLGSRFQILDLQRSVLLEAEGLAARYPVRALDAIHIATALLAAAALPASDSVVFYTADRRQAEAARAAGLQVEFVGEA